MKKMQRFDAKIFVAKVALGVGMASLLSGCGSSSPGTGGGNIELATLNGVEYGILERGTLVTTATSVTGTGKIIVREPRPKDDSNYALGFTLDPGGSVKLATNADNKLMTGVTVTFSRPATGPLKVVVAVGSESYDVSADFTTVAVDRAITLDVDVHAHGHAIVWSGGQKTEYAFTTRVSGKLWGLVLDKATVTVARAAKAKEEHP